LRYIIVNQTDLLKAKAIEKRNINAEIKTFRELNKGNSEKKCISKYLGLRDIDYKEVDYLYQFVSPYSKIFTRDKTGSSAKFQRKITRAIKRARHMALMSFTPKHNK
jgi:small subunit ribosomal protein S18